MELFLRKEIKRKLNAIRINSKKDIPLFLSTSISIIEHTIYYISMKGMNENPKSCPIGSVIGWDTSQLTNTGFYCWHITNFENILEKDSFFYLISPLLRAEPIGDKLPDFFHGCTVGGLMSSIVRHNENSWMIYRKNHQKVIPFWQGYWVFEEKKSNIHILLKNDISYTEYLVCDKNGKSLGLLCEINPP